MSKFIPVLIWTLCNLFQTLKLICLYNSIIFDADDSVRIKDKNDEGALCCWYKYLLKFIFILYLKCKKNHKRCSILWFIPLMSVTAGAGADWSLEPWTQSESLIKAPDSFKHLSRYLLLTLVHRNRKLELKESWDSNQGLCYRMQVSWLNCCPKSAPCLCSFWG